MEPSLISEGNDLAARRGARIFDRASMEPSLISEGNVAPAERGWIWVAASMEPSLISEGNSTAAPSERAVKMLQWSPR